MTAMERLGNDWSSWPTDCPVATGGGISSVTLLEAYRRGLFVWPPSDPERLQWIRDRWGEDLASERIVDLGPPGNRLELPWWSADPRAVLPVREVRVVRSLRSRFRKSGWTCTADRSPHDVIRRCGVGRGDPSWLDGELTSAFLQLADEGWLHSVEVWSGSTLVGGIFGVGMGTTFFGESGFSDESDAFKAAVVDLARRAAEAGLLQIDSGSAAPHLRRLGARPVDRSTFYSASGLGSGAGPVRLGLEERAAADLEAGP